MKIKLGDNVQIMSGRDKGMAGEVLKVLPHKTAVVVKGVNLRKKHQRQVQAGGRTMNPGIIQFEAPINVSNVMLICPSCKEPSRVGIHRVDGEAQRYCKKCQAVLDV
ncbi:MAG: 50S ribosomal protein L24 [Anaerolineales bacterium]|nr:50S ribosomal protein L24 [Anaerolineales bacterium]